MWIEFGYRFLLPLVLKLIFKDPINTIVCVLIEKESKKSDEFWSGRTTQNTVVVFPKKKFSPGDFVDVRIENCTSATLIGNGLRISKDI